jgi:hypothetical protein
MQAQHPADGGVRLRRVCDPDRAEPVSGRLFLCLGCRSQVIICRCCDRGQVYCSGDCSRRARRQSVQAAARRYEASLPGRRAHATRMDRYRAKLAQSSDGVAVGMADEGRQREIVTHQGSPLRPANDCLPAGAIATTSDQVSPAERPQRSTSHCHWCGRPCLPQLRQGFLRRRDRHRGRVDHTRMERKPLW